VLKRNPAHLDKKVAGDAKRICDGVVWHRYGHLAADPEIRGVTKDVRALLLRPAGRCSVALHVRSRNLAAGQG
jgi:hypothetical protein